MATDISALGTGALGISVSGQQISLAKSLSGSSDSPEEKKLKKAAGDFESILLSSMWKSMKQSFGSSETDDSDPAHGTLDDWGIEIMSGAVGKAGGLGIGKMILKHLEPEMRKGDGHESSGSADSTKVSGTSADK